MRACVLQGHEGELLWWDVAFWAERLREAKYAITDEELRPYFALPAVLDGLFKVRGGGCGATGLREAEAAVQSMQVHAMGKQAAGSLTMRAHARCPFVARGNGLEGNCGSNQQASAHFPLNPSPIMYHVSYQVRLHSVHCHPACSCSEARSSQVKKRAAPSLHDPAAGQALVRRGRGGR